MADNFMNLDELDARSRNRKAHKSTDSEASAKKEPECQAEVVKEEQKETPVVDAVMVPTQPKAIGGRPKKVVADLALTPKDVEVLTLLATGAKKSAVADMTGISRRHLYDLLDSPRVKKILSNSRNRLEALAELAVDVVHKELLEGNVEVAQSLLKGIGAMKTSVTASKDGKRIERSIAEEIMETDGTTTRRVIKEHEDDSE